MTSLSLPVSLAAPGRVAAPGGIVIVVTGAERVG